MECNFDGNTDRLFCLGAYYFFKSSRKRSKIKELTFEDNVVEQDRLACMWEEGLTDPLAEQTRHKALTLLEQFGFSKQDYHAHINFPGGIPIDGPSAGAAMFLALYSAYTETPVPNTLALTGEIGLHGQILPVGGVEDKLEAAQQAGATLALIPQENWRGVYREIEVVPVGDAETLLRRVFPPGEGATLSEGMEFLVGQEIG